MYVILLLDVTCDADLASRFHGGEILRPYETPVSHMWATRYSRNDKSERTLWQNSTEALVNNRRVQKGWPRATLNWYVFGSINTDHRLYGNWNHDSHTLTTEMFVSFWITPLLFELYFCFSQLEVYIYLMRVCMRVFAIASQLNKVSPCLKFHQLIHIKYYVLGSISIISFGGDTPLW